MNLTLKNTTLLLIIIIGFLIFLSNAFKLNFSNKSIQFIEKTKNNQIIKHKKENSKILTKDPDILLNEFFKKENSSQFKETIVKVKQGQTFSEILDNFNFENKEKFKIINSISEVFNLRGLNVNQKIIFLTNENEIIEKIIIELDFKTNLVVNLDSQINVEKRDLETYPSIESKEYLITNSLYADGINNNLPSQILIKLIQLFSFDLDFPKGYKKRYTSFSFL